MGIFCMSPTVSGSNFCRIPSFCSRTFMFQSLVEGDRDNQIFRGDGPTLLTAIKKRTSSLTVACSGPVILMSSARPPRPAFRPSSWRNGDLQSAGRRHIAADETLPGFRRGSRFDRPPLPGPEIAQPPVKLLGPQLPPAGLPRERQSVGHGDGGHHVLGRQIARIGNVDLIGYRGAEAGRRRPVT